MIYLDNASTTKIDPEVLKEMMPCLEDCYGNPGSIHYMGVEARKYIDIARERVARAINADPDDIIFTSGGSESNNLAVKFVCDIWGKPRCDILTSNLEHDSMKKAVSRYAYNAEFLPYYDRESMLGYIDDSLQRKNIDAVSFMYVNNELGIINPVREICTLGNSNLAITIVDAVQALGSEEIDVKKLDCDLLSISSHKIHGPKGVGALYVHKNFIKNGNLHPLILGGDNQEFGLRGGTENVAGIVGFGKACELINIDKNKATISALRKEFLNGLNFEHRVNFDREDSKIISLTIPGVDAETLVLMLSSPNGVCISAGSACKSLEQKPNEVLLAAGMSEDESRNTVRISLSEMNSSDEMKKSAEIINCCVNLLNK